MLRSDLAFSMTLSNSLILYSNDSGWMSISATGDITEQLSTLSIASDPAYIRVTALANMHFLLLFEA